MTENFKIRKNTSLKEIKQVQSTKKSSKDLSNMQFKQIKQQQKRNLLKMIHLEPIKVDSSNHQTLKKSEMKFDLTQPVNIKANNFTRPDSRYENVFLMPLEGKQEFRQKSLDKENRPSSMNELNYLNMARMKLTIQNTLKNQSPKMRIHQKRQCPLEEIKINQIFHRNSQSKILKSQSRARLLKLGQKDKMKLAENEERKQNQGTLQSTFRKGIIEQIFQKNKLIDQKSCQTIQIKENILNQCSIQSKHSIDTYNNSPKMKKQETIFEVDCSTINEREENHSSFISKKAAEQLINPLQLPSEFSHDKTQYQKKRKFQLDKIRKKFPENFFK